MLSIGDYNKIMSDRNIFNQIVYTPLSEALQLLEERQKDTELMAKVEKLLNDSIPDELRNNKCAIMARQIVTPNYDVRSFISIAIDNNLKPVFFENTDDKFVCDNEYKHSLGQLIIHNQIDKAGNFIEEKFTVIDFNKSNGKKLKEVKTLTGETLEEFHKKLFTSYGIDLSKICFLNCSDWVNKNGKKAANYYSNFFLFFICNGILFENFVISGSDGLFAKEVVLPAIEEVINLTGIKPIIVPIPPMDIEDDSHWMSHDKVVKQFIN